MKPSPETRERANQKIKERRAAWFASNGPCVNCGSKVDLQLHHIDKDTKESHQVWSWAKERREAELLKCTVLCRACHLLHHRKYAAHGTASKYSSGCRCQPCTAAKTELTRQWRLKKYGKNSSKP